MAHGARFATKLHVPLSTAGRILLLTCLLSAAAGALAAAPVGANTAVQESPGAAPSHLVIENVGQYAAEARFLLKQGNQHIWVTDDAVWLTVPHPAEDELRDGSTGRTARRPRQRAATHSGTALRFTFRGANMAASLEPFGRVATRVSYLIGSDPSRWQRDVPVWSGVRYRNLYPGIDLVIGDDARGTIPWRLEARAGADVNRVALQVEGAAAAAGEDGRLRLDIQGRGVDLALPAWAMAGRSDQVGSTVVRQAGDAFAIAPTSEGQVAIESAAGMAAAPDATGPVYSTYLGGSAWDAGYAIAVDYLGNAYVTGETESTDFPGATGSYTSAVDAFVAKVNQTGTALVYATYLGGSGEDIGGGIAVSGSLAYVVGETKSMDFPGAVGGAGNSDIFTAALNASGNDFLHVSLLGGSAYDTGTGIALDGAKIYVVGSTNSPTVAGTTSCAGSINRNVLVARLNALGAAEYVTCLGGISNEEGYAIAVHQGVAYVTGQSWSSDFPGTPPPGGWPGAGDILVASLGTTGARLNSTLIGGTGEDWGNGIAVDGDGNLYVAGGTSSLLFPITSGSSSYGGGPSDAVVLKLNGLLGIDFATYLGGSCEDIGYGIAVDTVKGFYMAGTTASSNFPVGTGALAGETDVFVARMHLGASAPNKVTYATYLGGTSFDENYGVATDTAGNLFVTGSTESLDFPALSWFDNVLGGENDGFVAKIAASEPPAAPAVTIAATAPNVALTWGAVNLAHNYQVFQSSQPYFKPGDWSSPLPLIEPTGLAHNDPVLLLPDAYFYVVKAVSATSEAGPNSKRVGKFTFQLTPGGPG